MTFAPSSCHDKRIYPLSNEDNAEVAVVINKVIAEKDHDNNFIITVHTTDVSYLDMLRDEIIQAGIPALALDTHYTVNAVENGYVTLSCREYAVMAKFLSSIQPFVLHFPELQLALSENWRVDLTQTYPMPNWLTKKSTLGYQFNGSITYHFYPIDSASMLDTIQLTGP